MLFEQLEVLPRHVHLAIQLDNLLHLLYILQPKQVEIVRGQLSWLLGPITKITTATEATFDFKNICVAVHAVVPL